MKLIYHKGIYKNHIVKVLFMEKGCDKNYQQKLFYR